MFPSPSHSTSPKEMDVTVPDIQELLPHVKHTDVFVLIRVPCRNRSRCGGPNPEKCRGRWRPWPSRSPRDMRVSRRPVLCDDGTAVFMGRSLPCRCHSERCDPNTYVPVSRMLKKSVSGVLASLRGSRMSESLEGLFRSPRSIRRANSSHEVLGVPPRLFARCGLAGQPF